MVVCLSLTSRLCSCSLVFSVLPVSPMCRFHHLHGMLYTTPLISVSGREGLTFVSIVLRVLHERKVTDTYIPPPFHQTRHNQDTNTQMSDHLQRRRSQEGRTTTPEQSVQVQWIPDRIHTQSHQQKDTRTTWSATKHKNLHHLH